MREAKLAEMTEINRQAQKRKETGRKRKGWGDAENDPHARIGWQQPEARFNQSQFPPQPQPPQFQPPPHFDPPPPPPPHLHLEPQPGHEYEKQLSNEITACKASSNPIEAVLALWFKINTKFATRTHVDLMFSIFIHAPPPQAGERASLSTKCCSHLTKA